MLQLQFPQSTPHHKMETKTKTKQKSSKKYNETHASTAPATDKLRPMREHGSALLYVHGNHDTR